MSSLYFTIPVLAYIYVKWCVGAYADTRRVYCDYSVFEMIAQAILLFIVLSFFVICVHAIVDNPTGSMCDF